MNSIYHKLKAVLVELAADDKLPLDLNELDPSVFESVIEPFLKTQETIANLSYMAGVDRYYTGDWRSDMERLVTLSEQFEKENEGVDWNAPLDGPDDESPDYLTSLENFYAEHIRIVKKLAFDYPAGATEPWDNIEVYPCKDDGESTSRLDGDEEETPDFWTVYLHRVEGGTMAVADLPTEKDALDVAELIHNAVISFKDNGYMPLYRNDKAHRHFNLFIDERIKMASSPQTQAAYETVKDQFNKLVKP